MTTPVNCDEAEKALLDMAYGEVAYARVADLEVHYAGCASCAQALAKVKRGIALGRQLRREAAPSMSVVLLAARERAAAIRAAKTVEVEPPVATIRETKTEAPFQGFFARLGRVAMGPQLGVATVLLVVVGIGLWYLPRLRSPSALEVATLEPDPMTGAETQALAPADPLELTHDPRTGRVVATADVVPVNRVRVGAAATERVAPRVVHEPEEAGEELRVAMIEVPSEEASGSVHAEPLAEMPSAAGATVAAPATPAPPTMPAHQQATAEPEASRDDNELGATTLHAEARALAQSERCSESVNAYQRLLREHPQYRDGSRASLEMSACLRTLGRIGEAREALTRASRSPVSAVAAGARRALVEMNSETRAVEAVAAPTAN